MKEVIGKPHHFAQNQSFTAFQEKEKETNIFQEYQQAKHTQPEVGHYEPQFTQIDKHIPDVKIEKQAEREELNTSKVSVELVIDPEKPKPHLPTIDFAKQVARPGTPKQEETELLLDPDYNVNKPKVACLVQIGKQLSRPATPEKKAVELVLEVNYD